jgi:hypothetical protein
MERTLYDNQNILYTEWYDDFVDWCVENGYNPDLYDDESDFFHQWVQDSLSMEWEDFINEIQYIGNNNTECVVSGFVGRWNGRFEITPKRFSNLVDAIMQCVEDCDYIVITTSEDGELHIISTHHDASNEFYIHKLNDLGREVEDVEELRDYKYFDKFDFE